jgi:hypothetical protein
VRERVFSLASKWLVYSLLIPRWTSSTNITLYVGNVVSSVLAVLTKEEFSIRIARLCVTNLVTLYFGGGSSFILDKVLRLPLSDTGILHRWVGRLTLIEGCIHGIIELSQPNSVLNVTTIHLSVSAKTNLDL